LKKQVLSDSIIVIFNLFKNQKELFTGFIRFLNSDFIDYIILELHTLGAYRVFTKILLEWFSIAQETYFKYKKLEKITNINKKTSEVNWDELADKEASDETLYWLGVTKGEINPNQNINNYQNDEYYEDIKTDYEDFSNDLNKSFEKLQKYIEMIPDANEMTLIEKENVLSKISEIIDILPLRNDFTYLIDRLRTKQNGHDYIHMIENDLIRLGYSYNIPNNGNDIFLSKNKKTYLSFSIHSRLNEPSSYGHELCFSHIDRKNKRYTITKDCKELGFIILTRLAEKTIPNDFWITIEKIMNSTEKNEYDQIEKELTINKSKYKIIVEEGLDEDIGDVYIYFY
ncbi:TPA: hypothetical protein QCY44_006238, partial [Bacillus cereus]|nr:hypothetical protein [Bacillus cereus]